MLVGRFQILLEEKMHVVGNFSKLSQTYGSLEKQRELPVFQKEQIERKEVVFYVSAIYTMLCFMLCKIFYN